MAQGGVMRTNIAIGILTIIALCFLTGFIVQDYRQTSVEQKRVDIQERERILLTVCYPNHVFDPSAALPCPAFGRYVESKLNQEGE